MQGTVLGPGVGVVGLGPLWDYGGLRRLVGYHIMVLLGRCLFNVCVYIYIHICLYVSMFVCIYAYKFMCIYVYRFICLCVYISVRVCVYVIPTLALSLLYIEKTSSRGFVGFHQGACRLDGIRGNQ